MTPRPLAWLCAALALGAGPVAPASALPDPPVLQSWVDAMKRSPRGPFDGIGWFCQNGSVRPARAGCSGHGGGVQHGTWSARTRALRDGGYQLGNLLVTLEPVRFVGPRADLDAWRQLVLERFLVGLDEGWIFRGAQNYRGAFQVEDEERAAQRLLLAMLADPGWRDASRFLLLRESVRLLPVAVDPVSSAAVRARAAQLAARDPGFAALRAKIHGFPDGGDAQRVRDHAARRTRPALAADYAALAHELDALYAPQGAASAVLALAPRIGNRRFARQLRQQATQFQAEVNPGLRIAAAARLMRALRDRFPDLDDPEVALETLLTSLALEREVYAAGADALAKVERSSTRRSRLELLAYDAEALYGAGFLSARELAEVEAATGSIASRNPRLREYREVVGYLGRVPEWSGRRLAFEFGPTLERWAAIEPLALQYPADRLRGGPLLFYSGVHDGLGADANRLAGVEHRLFGAPVAGGLRALNPGLARGVLRTTGGARLRPDGIYLLSATTADLPPVAGILTRGEGSSLSHLQLLARNFGIPNVLVGDDLVPRLAPRANARSVLAVSPGGVVQLAADGPQWDAVFGSDGQPAGRRLEPDLTALDLAGTGFLPLSTLRSVDAGRVCGPKGANLGELTAAFGDAVPGGFVIPFGAFRRVLDQPIERGGPPAFTWMQARYAEIGRAPGPRRERLVAQTLARLRAFLARAEPGPAFEEELRGHLARLDLAPGEGVFVRSDTNVEDLPGFSGAGLNRTVPNVVGIDAVRRAIREVWASPFEERAWAWRQAHMAAPELVFPSVVVQRAFASEKSGVLVTVDVESGDPGWLSIAANEGVGGAVDGQAAESLRVDTKRGTVRLLASAAAPTRKVLAPGGGIAVVPATGNDVVFDRKELEQLVKLARELPRKIPALRDPASGAGVPADVEFAFRRGRLALLQVRPFNESRRAQASRYLAGLDAQARERGEERISIGAVPETDASMAALDPRACEAAMPSPSCPR